jgi:hypothetical protein
MAPIPALAESGFDQWPLHNKGRSAYKGGPYFFALPTRLCPGPLRPLGDPGSEQRYRT